MKSSTDAVPRMTETWGSVFEKSVQLSEMIREHCIATGERFDCMLVVPRGGYYPANIVSRELGFSASQMLHASIGSYDGESQNSEFKLGQMPSAEDITGKNILVIEEVCDTGQTMAFLHEYLKQQGAELVRCGVLHYKPKQSKTHYQPDWAVTTTDAWIEYPWEIHDNSDKQVVTRTQL